MKHAINLQLNRRLLLTACLGALTTTAWAANTLPLVDVWKDPDCGCCEDWVKHLKLAGFAVQIHTGGNAAKRASVGIPERLGSCHTATVAGYAIEGHVPAKDIQRLLRDKPQAIGLAVPGMPVGSPGMDGPEYKGRKDPFDVLVLAKNGSTTVFQSYR